jgi:multicomponent Na+:H+ antiporter subunit E
MIFNLLLRLVIWFLLTANFSLVNIIIGLVVALALPGLHLSLLRQRPSSGQIRELLQSIKKILLAIPQAYWESIEIILHPHEYEEVVMERIKTRRSPKLIFLDIFLITFTPKTIVLKYHEAGYYEVHYLRRRQP